MSVGGWVKDHKLITVTAVIGVIVFIVVLRKMNAGASSESVSGAYSPNAVAVMGGTALQDASAAQVTAQSQQAINQQNLDAIDRQNAGQLAIAQLAGQTQEHLATIAAGVQSQQIAADAATSQAQSQLDAATAQKNIAAQQAVAIANRPRPFLSALGAIFGIGAKAVAGRI